MTRPTVADDTLLHRRSCVAGARCTCPPFEVEVASVMRTLSSYPVRGTAARRRKPTTLNLDLGAEYETAVELADITRRGLLGGVGGAAIMAVGAGRAEAKPGVYHIEGPLTTDKIRLALKALNDSVGGKGDDIHTVMMISKGGDDISSAGYLAKAINRYGIAVTVQLPGVEGTAALVAMASRRLKVASGAKVVLKGVAESEKSLLEERFDADESGVPEWALKKVLELEPTATFVVGNETLTAERSAVGPVRKPRKENPAYAYFRVNPPGFIDAVIAKLGDHFIDAKQVGDTGTFYAPMRDAQSVLRHVGRIGFDGRVGRVSAPAKEQSFLEVAADVKQSAWFQALSQNAQKKYLANHPSRIETDRHNGMGGTPQGLRAKASAVTKRAKANGQYGKFHARRSVMHNVKGMYHAAAAIGHGLLGRGEAAQSHIQKMRAHRQLANQHMKMANSFHKKYAKVMRRKPNDTVSKDGGWHARAGVHSDVHPSFTGPSAMAFANAHNKARQSLSEAKLAHADGQPNTARSKLHEAAEHIKRAKPHADKIVAETRKAPEMGPWGPRPANA